MNCDTEVLKREIDNLGTALKEANAEVSKFSIENSDLKVRHRREIEALNATILNQALEIQRLRETHFVQT